VASSVDVNPRGIPGGASDSIIPWSDLACPAPSTVQSTAKEDQQRSVDLDIGRRGRGLTTRGWPATPTLMSPQPIPIWNCPDPPRVEERDEGKQLVRVVESKFWEDFDCEIHGRVLSGGPAAKWEWSTLASQGGRAPLITNQLVGHVDNPS
jgi:hypothetical protein